MMNFRMHRPKQVIVVALLTSLFWFLFNIGLLYTYQGNIVVNFGQVTNQQEHLSSQVKDNLPGNLNDVELTRGERNDQSENDNNIRDQQTTAEKNKDVEVRFLSDKFLSKKKKKLKIEKDDNNNNNNLNEVVERQLIPTKTKEVFDFDKEEEKRDPNGPGENGQAVVVDSNEKDEENNGFKKHAFNELASKKISLHRSIPDTREMG